MRLCISMSGLASSASRNARIPAGSTCCSTGELRGNAVGTRASVDRRAVTAVCQTSGMPEWFSGDIVANGLRIHYSRTGGDKPALVLSHGATDSGLCWTRVARALEADYDVILPDARGHGLSDAPPSGYSS